MIMDISKILFLDIETVPQYADFDSAPEVDQKLWGDKARIISRDQEVEPSSVYERAGIYAEFGRIVCISVGFISQRGTMRQLRVKSYYGDDEKILLTEFADLLLKHFNGADNLLCGHNGKEFDFPYIARRMIINRVKIPRILDSTGKKPWEVNHLDTMQMWKFGDFKNFTSLKLLAHVFGIPSPKDDIDGSQVAGVYWEEKNLERIMRYCEKDVVTLVQVYLSLTQEPMLTEDELN
ncbi:3'-5' exonuclease [bacterium]|nr:3'-5' exonuclease [bacterium]MDC1221677.1 3'-5' exonuclease [Salibacteraceae bacterium]